MTLLINNVRCSKHLKLVHHFSFKIIKVNKSTLQFKPMNSYDAVKKIKHLEKCNEQNMVKEAFKIFNNLDESQQNEYVIHALLNVCKKMLKKTKDIDTMKVINYIKKSVINTNDNIYVKNSLISIYLQCKDM
eukprot:470320_1